MRLTKSAIKSLHLKREKVAKVKRCDCPFKNVDMRDILHGQTNSVGNKRSVKTNANGMRWSVNRLRYA